jgi:uncharacterized delta-60 repeat protein
MFLLDQRQPAGVYLFGGFTQAGGTVRYGLARFDSTGALDPTFVLAKELSSSSSSLNRRSPIIADSFTAPFANAVQANGKPLILVKDPVITVGATGTARLVRLNLDGSLDAAFHGPVVGISFDTTSNTITLPLANGKIVFFSDGILQRLNSDGSRDTTFAIVHATNNSWGAPIASLKLIPQSDGGYLLYGRFDAVNGVARKSIARVTGDGALDAMFDPASKTNTYERFEGAVLQPDQKILLHGAFTAYPGTTSNCIIRVLPDGDLDPSFNDVHVTLSADTPTIDKVFLQPDGRIIIVGFFTGVDGVARNKIARLNSEGSFDSTFDAGGVSGSNITGLPSVLLQPDGKLILYGDYFSHDGPNLIRLNANGSLDFSFSPGGIGQGVGYGVPKVELLPNLQLLVLGGFYRDRRNGFGRLNSNGILDETYDPAATLFSALGTGAQAIVPTAEGKLCVGGVYQMGFGVPRLSIERLNNDGTVDTGFDPGSGPWAGYGTYNGVASVGSIAIQTDGKIIAGGRFYSFNGVNRGGIVRLETNGSVDLTFNPGDTSTEPPPTTTALAIATNGQIYASGKFMGQAQGDSLARINREGTLDATFHPARIPGPNGMYGPAATSMAVQPDGKLVFIFGLNFSPDQSGLARFNTDGSLDTTFAAGAATPGVIRLGGRGRAVRIQADGKIVLGGSFLPNSDPAVADSNYIKHANLERFNSDGTPDTSFDSGGSGPNAEVLGVFVEPNGAIVIGGYFTYVNGIVRRGVALLTSSGDVNESIDPGEGPDNTVYAVAAQGDGKLLLTGPFTSVGTVPKAGIARLLVPSGQLLNLSTRMQVLAGENVLITGFIVTGTAPKRMLIRGLGPSLPLSGQLNDPILELFDGAGVSIGTNDDWRDTQEQEIEDTKIPPANDRESALLKTVPPGTYTAVLHGKNNGTGVGLVEVYDLSATGSQLGNISTRGFVGRDNDVMIGGVIVGQSPNGSSAMVLVRAIGPSLTAHGISGPLLDPTLELRNANGGLMAQNDNWRVGEEQSITDTAIPPEDDRESALVQVLPAGNYTAIVGGKEGATGVGLIEIYNLQ